MESAHESPDLVEDEDVETELNPHPPEVRTIPLFEVPARQTASLPAEETLDTCLVNERKMDFPLEENHISFDFNQNSTDVGESSSSDETSADQPTLRRSQRTR